MTMKIGQLLDCWLEKKDLSHRQLAKEIGMDHTVLFRITKEDREMDGKTMMKLLAWLFSNGEK